MARTFGVIGPVAAWPMHFQLGWNRTLLFLAVTLGFWALGELRYSVYRRYRREFAAAVGAYDRVIMKAFE